MTKHMNKSEDKMAHRLFKDGKSFREIGRAMNRNDKTIKQAVERHEHRLENGNQPTDIDAVAVQIFADYSGYGLKDDAIMRLCLDEAWSIAIMRGFSFCELVSAIDRAFVKGDK